MIGRLVSKVVVLVGIPSLLACSSAVPSAPAAPMAVAAPQFASVHIEQIVIAPTKSNGAEWDVGSFFHDSGPARSAASAIRIAMGQSPYAGVAYAATAPLIRAVAKTIEAPDLGGVASVEWSGESVATEAFEGQRDSFTPSLQIGWSHVPLTDGAAIRLQLIDRDFNFDDPIGNVTINARDLRALASAGEGHAVPFRVDGQTAGQALFVLISVLPETSIPRPSGSPVVAAR